jgi:hypothetical protein
MPETLTEKSAALFTNAAAARALEGQREDPDIDKTIVVKGAAAVNVEAKGG